MNTHRNSDRNTDLGTDGPYDVVVVGGGLAGSSTALLLRDRLPDARILVVERRRAFDRKVGEATVEVSAHFLAHDLGLEPLLEVEHLPKHGFDFWFHATGAERLEEMSEVGNLGPPELPSFLVDRQLLDEALLERMASRGIEVARPARVLAADPGLEDGTLTYEEGGRRRTVRTRWIVDASGRRRWLGKALGLARENADLPTVALWARWRGVKDLDDPETLAPAPGATRRRGRCTNHFMRRGAWTWLIALPGGDVSIGTVFDRRHFTLPEDGRGPGAYAEFLRSSPGLRELLADAELVPGDFRSYEHLPYTTERYAGPGYALVGDAATFLDPFYSPGLDHLAMSATATAALIGDDLAGELTRDALRARIRRHDERFVRSARRWFEALYRDKYELFGDAELTATTFYVDTGLYYLGVVGPALRNHEGLGVPVLGAGNWQSGAAFRFMRFFHWRLSRLARKRTARGAYGRRNVGWRVLGPSFGRAGRVPNPGLRFGLRMWLGLELTELRASLRRTGKDRPEVARGAPAVAPGGKRS